MPLSPDSSGLASPEVAESGDLETPRWPRVVGTIGIIAGALMFLDKLDDLLLLPVLRSRDWWARLLGEELGEQVVRWMPSGAWIAGASLIGMTLGALLVVGALRLRRGRRSGVALCRAWSWLAIVWLVIEMSQSLWWLSGHAAELQELARGDWQGAAVLGILLAIVALAALPVFLLSWFSRPVVKAQFAG